MGECDFVVAAVFHFRCLCSMKWLTFIKNARNGEKETLPFIFSIILQQVRVNTWIMLNTALTLNGRYIIVLEKPSHSPFRQCGKNLCQDVTKVKMYEYFCKALLYQNKVQVKKQQSKLYNYMEFSMYFILYFIHDLVWEKRWQYCSLATVKWNKITWIITFARSITILQSVKMRLEIF